MTDEQLKLADDLPTILDGWAKAYRDSPEHRFPSDPHAEFFPLDLENAAKALRAATGPAPTEAVSTNFTDNTCEDRRLLAAGYKVCGSDCDDQWHWCAPGGRWHDGYKTEHAAVMDALAALSVGEAVSAARPSDEALVDEVIASTRDYFTQVDDSSAGYPITTRARNARKALERRLAALPSEAIGREWHDISTAPKDGTKIDLLFAYPRGRQNDCQWRHGDIYGDGGWYWSIPRWGSQPGLGIDWHLLPEEEWETGCYPNMEPTHWIPLPAGPSVTRPTRGTDK